MIQEATMIKMFSSLRLHNIDEMNKDEHVIPHMLAKETYLNK